MGKKKSKIAKVKQAKAKHSNGKNQRSTASSLGGISLSKGATSKFQQQAASGKSLTLVGIRHKGVIQSSPFSTKFDKPKGKAASSSTSPLVSTNTSSTMTNEYDEKSDFDRQRASLQERQAAKRNTITKQKKSTLLKEGGVVSSFIQSFQPASFQFEKTATDLFHETLDQMQNMSGVGTPRPAAESLLTPIRNNQSWANVTLPKESLADKNPFAALEEEDEESDNEYKQTPIIQMAPPSFALLPRITPTPATTPVREPHSTSVSWMPNANDDIDPDL